jgi:diaminopimelate decarboxylase
MQKSLVTDELLREPLSIRGDRLFIDDCDTVGLAEQFGTPLYVVSESATGRPLSRNTGVMGRCGFTPP